MLLQTAASCFNFCRRRLTTGAGNSEGCGWLMEYIRTFCVLNTFHFVFIPVVALIPWEPALAPVQYLKPPTMAEGGGDVTFVFPSSDALNAVCPLGSSCVKVGKGMLLLVIQDEI